jgi:hypothetical protein
LTAYKAVAVESVRFIGAELENLEKTCIKASDVLGCISVGINTALNDRIPYKDTPILIETVGAFGVGKTTGQLPSIPYAGITMAGICWGINGSLAEAKAREESMEAKIETERMACVLDGLKAVENRVVEGETLLYALSGKLKKSLATLQSLAGDNKELSDEAAKELDVSVNLVKSIKQVIETDICDASGFLTKKSGVIFRKIEKEIQDV